MQFNKYKPTHTHPSTHTRKPAHTHTHTQGPSGLRYSHLQAALCDELVEDLAAFATLVFSSRVLPHVFWTLHTSANLSALGQKARPVACGDVVRRVIGAVFCRRYGRKLADYFQPWGQYGVAVSGGIEIMAFTATLGFEECCSITSYDRRQRPFHKSVVICCSLARDGGRDCSK